MRIIQGYKKAKKKIGHPCRNIQDSPPDIKNTVTVECGKADRKWNTMYQHVIKYKRKHGDFETIWGLNEQDVLIEIKLDILGRRLLILSLVSLWVIFFITQKSQPAFL
jgi:hypothetical protein